MQAGNQAGQLRRGIRDRTAEHARMEVHLRSVDFHLEAGDAPQPAGDGGKTGTGHAGVRDP